MTEENFGSTPDQEEQQFVMQRIYTKDVSFESPDSPGVFLKTWQPKINVDLNTKSNLVDDNDNYEVGLSITVTAEIEEKSAFLVEVQQAGIFLAKGLEDHIKNKGAAKHRGSENSTNVKHRNVSIFVMVYIIKLYFCPII